MISSLYVALDVSRPPCVAVKVSSVYAVVEVHKGVIEVAATFTIVPEADEPGAATGNRWVGGVVVKEHLVLTREAERADLDQSVVLYEVGVTAKPRVQDGAVRFHAYALVVEVDVSARRDALAPHPERRLRL